MRWSINENVNTLKPEGKNRVGQDDNIAYAKWKDIVKMRLGLTPDRTARIMDLQRKVAHLVLDTRLDSTALAVGLRAKPAPKTGVSQLLYTVEDGSFEVDLQLHHLKEHKQISVIGQVVGAEKELALIDLVSLDSGLVLQTVPDETATFRFRNLEIGKYSMGLYYNYSLIEITPLVL